MKDGYKLGVVLAGAGLCCGGAGSAQEWQAQPAPRTGGIAAYAAQPARASAEVSGRYSTREGLRLRMSVEIGSIRITTVPGAKEVALRMRVETDPRQPEAGKLLRQVTAVGSAAPDGVHIQSSVPWGEFRGRIWVRFEVTTPRNYNLEVVTRAGNITTEDVDGRVNLSTFGGNIEAGNVSGTARLETRGGHVSIKNVGGELIAATAGGHVTAGHVGGSATLRTAGGHIRAAAIQGVGSAETGGGDIAISKTGAKFVAVSHGGGQITFGEASGAVEARTAGGGIRVLKVAGPMQLNSAGGSIYLTEIHDAVRASTASGNITAWFAGQGKKTAPSQLQCAEGDIVVYLPRQLALNIEAVIEGATSQKVEFDPAIPLKLMPVPKAGGSPRRVIRAVGSVNGGGETLVLRTVAGNIRLLLADREVVEVADRAQHLKLEAELRAQEARIRQQLEDFSNPELQQPAQEEVRSRIAEMRARLAEMFSRPLRVDAEEQKERLHVQTLPVYPAEARRAGIQGVVQLEVTIAEDGKVLEVRTLGGNAVLAEAARAAVTNWKYHPLLVRGRPVKVITRVDIEFRAK